MSALVARLQATLHPAYSVERELGGGGMSRVFLARETALDRSVVIKVLSPELAQSVSAERFRREIQLAASLQHPHIVPLFTAGEVPDLFGPGLPGPYYTMPFVEGESLRARLKQGGALPVMEALRILSDVTDALASAHEHGVVHRDIKPENILLTRQHAMVLDFGVAKALRAAAGADLAGEGATHPSLGIALGTPAYMAPEQAAADPAIDHRADIYALGAVAYEMLTGQQPFSAPSIQGLLAAQIGQLPKPLTAVRPGVPAPLAAAVMRCLEKQPADRWHTAAELLEALEACISGTAGAAQKRPSRRWAGALALAGAALVALVAFATNGALLGLWPGQPSLVAAGTLAPRERILLADFTNRTPDSLLGGAVTEALRVDLTQSPLVRVVGAEQVQDALRRMQRPAGIRLDPALAREVAIRDGMKAFLAGDVGRLGGEYIVSARLVAAESGEELTALQESAPDSTAIIGAVGRLSKRLRGRVGESLQSIRETPQLERVSTSSLDALRRYSQANRAYDIDGDQTRALALLDEAIALDTAFAMAYRKKGTILLNEWSGSSRGLAALQQAFTHRERLTDLERYLTMGSYYAARGEVDNAIAAYRSLLELHPMEARALNNVGLLYERRQDFDRAAEYYQRAVGVDSSVVAFQNLLKVQVATGDSGAADRTLALMARRYTTHPAVAIHRSELAAARGDYTGAQRALERFMAGRRDDASATAAGEMILADVAAIGGRLAEAQQHMRRAIAASERRGEAAAALDGEIFLAQLSAEVRRDPRRALATLDAALARRPLDSFPPLDRPYLALAHIYALVGRSQQSRAFLAEYELSSRERAQEGEGDMVSIVTAVTAMAERQPAEAMRLLADGNEETFCRICSMPYLARAYDLSGQVDSAIALYQRYITTPEIFRVKLDALYLAAAHERLGQLYEERGERRKAAEHFGRFIDLWQNADPDLQPRVADARRRLAAVASEPPTT